MFWLIFTVFDTALAAFCGSSLVPYSLEVLPGGGTVLGCARPTCFGWDPTTGQRASDDYSFIQQQGYRDGFLRGDPAQRQPFAPSVPQTATCFPALSCTSGQWASGFVAGQNGVAPSLMCCSYPPLAQAEDLGVAPVGPGNIAYGGEGPGGGQVAYFDYLRNIQPVMGADGQIAHYDVEMGRMHCQEPPALPAPVVPQQVYQPPAQPAYTPTSYWGSLPPYTCFPADSKVLMYDMTERRMDELEISEWVMTPSSNLSSLQGNQIKNWLHRMPEIVTEFLVITTGQGKEVKLTRRHLIVRVSCADPGETETIPAEEVELGDCILEMEEHRLLPTSVVGIRLGIYAPLTDSGRLIVDGLVVSCFSEVSDSTLTRNWYADVVECAEDYCSVSETRADLLFDMARLILPNGTF